MSFKIALIYCLSLVIVLWSSLSFAYDPVPSPKPDSAISDQSHVLTDNVHQKLDAQLKQINQRSANEIAVLILPSLDGENIDDIGYVTAKSWGVGKKDLDNGVLIVLAIKEHKSRIETGKRVEGDLPDLKCNDILHNIMGPYLHSGNFELALSSGFSAIELSIENHKLDAALSTTHKPSKLGCAVSSEDIGSSDDDWITAAVIFVCCALGVWYIVNRPKKNSVSWNITHRYEPHAKQKDDREFDDKNE